MNLLYAQLSKETILVVVQDGGKMHVKKAQFNSSWIYRIIAKFNNVVYTSLSCNNHIKHGHF